MKKSRILLIILITATALAQAQQVITPGSLTGAEQNDRPSINSPVYVGVRTGKQFFYTIPVSGAIPIQVKTGKLPAGVQWDSTRHMLYGKLIREGKYTIGITAQNKWGTSRRSLTVQAGDLLALTPPMGWSSWYSYGRKVTEQDVLRTAELMKEKQLDTYGWNIIEIDDPWTNQPSPDDSTWIRLKNKASQQVYGYYEGPGNLPGRTGATRDTNGNLLPNQYFTHIAATVKAIHALGFKVGIYSSPGPLTCGGVAGSYGHEWQDAAFFARTGFDYLKYDWCSYGSFAKNNSLEELQQPYKLMGDALKAQQRDIIYALCQYGMGDVWKWGYETGAQLWRTGDDVRDNWASVYAACKKLADKSAYVQPGRWNDPDILQVGPVGAESRDGNSNHLSFEEQRTVMSMWCLLSAPLLIGANLEKIDAAGLSLFTNNEVIAINQDALGKAAKLQQTINGQVEVWVKPLYGGDYAIGLLNISGNTVPLQFPLRNIGGKKQYQVRNLWQKVNLGKQSTLTTTLPSHSLLLLRLH